MVSMWVALEHIIIEHRDIWDQYYVGMAEALVGGAKVTREYTVEWSCFIISFLLIFN